jgi:zinc transport system ATP-binding protein
MNTLVEFQSVSKIFGKKTLLDGVSFKLIKGQITTLIGQNGAGKTTIAKMIIGLEKPTSGNIIIKDKINIGYVPQKLDFAFNMPVTCRGLLEMLSTSGVDNEIFELTGFLDYQGIKDKDISAISAGQLQKLLLAGTLMNKPDLVILDEPIQFLDVASQQQFYKVITGIKEKIGLTVFMISHDLFTVMRNSDQVICINGHVCCSGKPTDLNENVDFKNALSEIGVYLHSHDHDHKH